MLVKDKPGKTNMDVLTNLKKFVKKKKIKTRIAIFRQRNVNEIYLIKKTAKNDHTKNKKTTNLFFHLSVFIIVL